MKLVTWNVNSIKARLERVRKFIQREEPDILCLQELKVAEEAFPYEELNSLGYHAAVYGQKTYNGVAILSKEKPSDTVVGLPDTTKDDQARLVSTNIGVLRIMCAYVPNGKVVGSSSYEYKLAWLGRLREYLNQNAKADDKIVLCGDMNVALDDKDVANPEKWAESVLCHDEARKEFETLRVWGFSDVFRDHHPEGQVYSWWDYRMLAFPKGDGLRIDYILATKPVAAKCTAARVDRNERKGKLPSDHAPVIAEFDL